MPRTSRRLAILHNEDRDYIQANGQLIAIRSKRAIGKATLQYVHHDHLGSVTALTNSDGSVAERQSFGAFGKRANGAWETDPKDRLYKKAYATDRGYTGQEQLDNLKLVNFHARLYDPVLGRFISPDSVVQFPDSTQGLNRYTYVNNNPLSYTDPDGHCIIICTTTAIYAAVVAGTTAAAVGEITHNALVTQIGFAILGAATGNLEAASAVGFGAGFTESGGNLKAGLYAAATAAAFYEVGSAFQVGDAGTDSGAAAQKFGQHAVLRYETHVVADGLVGGVSSEVMGGGFKSGFIGAGFGEAASGLLSKASFSNIPGINSVAGNVTASALIGGTASELSGGKFANGAVTAAFAAGFNDEAHIRASIHLPTPIEYLGQMVGYNIPSASFEFSFSFPGFNQDGVFNIGLSSDLDYTKGGFGLGSDSLSVVYNKKAKNIASMAGGAEAREYHVVLPMLMNSESFTLQMDSKGQLTGFGLGVDHGIDAYAVKHKPLFKWSLK